MKYNNHPLTCRLCTAYHISHRTRWNPKTFKEEIIERGECWGVSEPFEIKPDDVDKPCVAYPGKTMKFVEWPDFHGLIEVLVDRGFNTTKEVLEALDNVKEAPYGEEK